MVEAIGIIASVTILFGFMFKDERYIRIINTFGACLFVVYGIAINSFSVWFLNGALVLVHLYHLQNER